MTLKRLFIVTALASVSFVSLNLPIWAANPALKTGMDVKDMQQLEVNGIKIENFAGDVFVKTVGTGKVVRVSLKGSDDLLSQVLVTDNHGSDKGNLYVGFEKDVPTLTDVDKLILTIEAPASMPLNLTLVGGKAEVGDRDSNDTKLNLIGFGDIKATSLKNVESHIDGSGEITIVQIQGNASFAIRGDGKYSVRKGSINRLNATIQGTGLMNISAEVNDAELSSEGAGTINLTSVSGNLKQSMSGAGAISIAKMDGSLKHNVSGSSQLEMSCAKRSKG
jgi:hypothetical protein